MIDFQKLVSRMLLNEQPTPVAIAPTPIGNEEKIKADDNSEQIKAENTQKFLLDPKKYDEIKTTSNQRYEKVYKSYYKFPEKQEYDNLIRVACFNAIRGTKDSSKYPTIRSIFPVLDLVGLITQVYKTEQKATINEASMLVYNNFINKLKASIGAPMEYQPDSTWGKDVKASHYEDQQKINIGNIVLNSPELQSQSLYFVIMKLLEIRRKGKSGTIDLTKIPPTEDFINKILLNPDSFIRGKLPTPGDDIKALYNDISPQLILDVAKKVYELFVQQVESNLGNKEAFKSPIEERQAYKLFLNNQIIWDKYKTAQINSFEESYGNLYTQMLNEYNQDDKANDSSNNDKPKSKIFDTEKTKFPYTLKNIIANKAENPQTNNLYNSLEKLANYIREGTKRDIHGILSGATQLAQAAMLGTKMAGT
jgi:hypothetical protein